MLHCLESVSKGTKRPFRNDVKSSCEEENVPSIRQKRDVIMRHLQQMLPVVSCSDVSHSPLFFHLIGVPSA